MQSNFLFKPADIAPLAAFRILMGLLMACEGFGAIITGWVRTNYVDPDFSFNFIGFDFLQILVGPQAYVVYAALGCLGLAIAFGWQYRAAIIGYTILWAGVYFGQKTSYNNHYYLLLLMCFLFCLVPANRYASMDLRSGRAEKSQLTPYWTIWIFKFLLLIVYFYAALAKLYPDWLEGKPVGIFLSHKADYPILGSMVGEHWLIMLISYGGIAFDFLIVPALWYKPTRRVAFAISIGFHLFNSIVFQIGIFPYMMLITTVLFFEPVYIRKLFFRNSTDPSESNMSSSMARRSILWVLVPFFALMVILPLRPYFYPGSSHFTEEGHRLSWHMMLRSKQGTVYYRVVLPQKNKEIFVFPERELPQKMSRSMAGRPDMIWQYAQRLKARYDAEGEADTEIYAVSRASLNGRKMVPLIDPAVDLAMAEWSHLSHNEWVLTLTEKQ